jgi:hypothetical protein
MIGEITEVFGTEGQRDNLQENNWNKTMKGSPGEENRNCQGSSNRSRPIRIPTQPDQVIAYCNRAIYI